MRPFDSVVGVVAPLDRPNIDTDAIIPKQFLKRVTREGFGPNLFDAWRYLDEGLPDQNGADRPLNPEFVLNKPRYAKTEIILARANFGCGSSREHALWALVDYGIRAIIAPSFAEIFYQNCIRNGVLPVVLTAAEVEILFQEVEEMEGYVLSIDLRSQSVHTSCGRTMHFEIAPAHKARLLAGLDEIGVTLRRADLIHRYEEKAARDAPWLFRVTS